MNKYRLEKSKDLPGWWAFTDLENLVVIRFEDGKYNETQRVSCLKDDMANLGALAIAKIMREMGDYIVRYHSDIAFSHPYGFVYDAEDNLYLYRRKSPKWRLLIEEQTDTKTLSDSLKKAGEWLSKRISKKFL